MLKKLNRINTGPKLVRPVKVLQFGDGNFLRGFVDWIVDILNEKTDFNGDVQIVRPLRKGSAKKNDDQDGLYHVALMGLQHGKMVSENRLITCIAGVVDPYEDSERFLATAENPDLKFIVSNTTESGIVFNPADQSVDALGESFPAKVTQLLYHRFMTFKGDRGKGLIFLPCELIEKNGEALRTVILKYCEHWNLSPDFTRWINECNTFCNSLVDRIVPGFPKDSIQDIQEKTGYEDNQLVSAEPFHLWVIEAPAFVQDEFPAGKAGLSVKYVDDLTPYRTQKVRILNGAHTALTPVAYLHGLRTVKESVDNGVTGEFIRKAIYEEIIPTLELSEAELRQFANDVLERFQNPFIRHELKSIALNSISKFKVRVLPSILEYKKRTGKLPQKLIYSFASLIRFYKGNWKGEVLPVNDSPEVVNLFTDAWKTNDKDELLHSVLSNKSLWGEDLSKIDGLSAGLKSSLEEVERIE